jgi:hypothetical protein
LDRGDDSRPLRLPSPRFGTYIGKPNTSLSRTLLCHHEAIISCFFVLFLSLYVAFWSTMSRLNSSLWTVRQVGNGVVSSPLLSFCLSLSLSTYIRSGSGHVSSKKEVIANAAPLLPLKYVSFFSLRLLTVTSLHHCAFSPPFVCVCCGFLRLERERGGGCGEIHNFADTFYSLSFFLVCFFTHNARQHNPPAPSTLSLSFFRHSRLDSTLSAAVGDVTSKGRSPYRFFFCVFYC